MSSLLIKRLLCKDCSNARTSFLPQLLAGSPPHAGAGRGRCTRNPPWIGSGCGFCVNRCNIFSLSEESEDFEEIGRSQEETKKTFLS